MTTATISVAAGDDDFFEDGGSNISSFSDLLYAGNYSGANSEHLMMRFAVPLTSANTINSATWRLYAPGSTQTGAPQLIAYGDDVDNSADRTGALVNSRTKTTASTVVNIGSGTFSSAGWLEVDVKAIVEEILARGGWASGNYIGLMLINQLSTSTNEVGVEDLAAAGTNEGELVIVYDEGGTAYTITADESTFTLTAQDAQLVAPKNIVADQSTFTLSAQDATLTWSWGEYFQVEPADANTVSGESIFGGLTINSGSLVILPNLIGGIVATWETANGHATGRVSLASTLTDPTAVTIPYYNGSTWDTISVTFIDEGDITTTITADYASFTLSAQDANLVATRVITADQSTFALTVQDATLGLTGYSVDAAHSVFSLAAQAATLRYSAGLVVGIGQLSPSVRTSIRNSIRGSIT